MMLYLPNQTLRFEPCHLVSHSGRPARDRLFTAPPMARRRPYSRRQLLANAAIAASRVVCIFPSPCWCHMVAKDALLPMALPSL
jgi:hypothetical protein